MDCAELLSEVLHRVLASMVRYFKKIEMETAPQMEPLEPVPVSKSIANTKSSLLTKKQFRSTVLKAEERQERRTSARSSGSISSNPKVVCIYAGIC